MVSASGLVRTVCRHCALLDEKPSESALEAACQALRVSQKRRLTIKSPVPLTTSRADSPQRPGMDDRGSPFACSHSILRRSRIGLPTHWTGLDYRSPVATVGHEELDSSVRTNFLSVKLRYVYLGCHKCLRREAPLEQLPAYSA